MALGGRGQGLEQKKLEARKMLDAKRGDESHLSSARFIGRVLTYDVPSADL